LMCVEFNKIVNAGPPFTKIVNAMSVNAFTAFTKHVNVIISDLPGKTCQAFTAFTKTHVDPLNADPPSSRRPPPP
jgi:hypothetical protein